MRADPGTTQPDNEPGASLRKSSVVVGAIIGGVLGAKSVSPWRT